MPLSKRDGGNGMARRFYAFLAAIVLGFAVCGALRAGDTTEPSGTADLELQVAALNTLDELDVTPEQLKQLSVMAAETAGTAAPDPGTAKGSAEYHTALQALRDALANGEDDKVDDAQEKVDDLRENQNIDPNIDYDITDAAKTKAAAALKLMGTDQIANYISMHSDEVPDAAGTILDALDKCKDASDADFASLRQEAADQVGLLAAGFDKTAADAIEQKVTTLLNRARQMPQKQFDAGRDELDRRAHQITKSVDSFKGLQYWMAREMADLLSNPQIQTVLADRIKAENQGQ
jgi:hypothetical protein